jgi:hypothetical protein
MTDIEFGQASIAMRGKVWGSLVVSQIEIFPELLGREFGAVDRRGCKGEPHSCFLSPSDGPSSLDWHLKERGSKSF